MTDTPACVRCGRDAQVDIASVWLCLECYHVAGSTCAGIGRMPAPGTSADHSPPEPIDDAQVC